MHYNFTDRTRKVLAFARDEAIRLGHDHVATEHILLGLVREGEGVAAAVLMNLRIDLPGVKERVEELTSRGTTPGAGDLPYTSGAREVLNFASNEAQELNHAYIGTEHVLLGLLREENGIAVQALRSFGVTPQAARDEIRRLLGGA
jgi:ATP-dependent Clp protease ATP-binding subunit ClpC